MVLVPHQRLLEAQRHTETFLLVLNSFSSLGFLVHSNVPLIAHFNLRDSLKVCSSFLLGDQMGPAWFFVPIVFQTGLKQLCPFACSIIWKLQKCLNRRILWLSSTTTTSIDVGKNSSGVFDLWISFYLEKNFTNQNNHPKSQFCACQLTFRSPILQVICPSDQLHFNILQLILNDFCAKSDNKCMLAVNFVTLLFHDF